MLDKSRGFLVTEHFTLNSSLEKFENERNKTNTAFYKTKVGATDDDTLEQRLGADTIKSVFALQDDYKNVKNSYQGKVEALTKAAKQTRLTTYAAIAQLRKMHHDARTAINTQQKFEIDELKKQLEAKIPPTDPKMVATLTKKLDEHHKEQMAQFNTDTNNNEIRLLVSAALEQRRYSIITELEKQKHENLAALKKENKERRGIQAPKDLTVSHGDDLLLVSSLDPKKLEYIYSFAGYSVPFRKVKIHHDPATGMWSMNLNFMSNDEEAIRTLIAAVRASGEDSITLTFSFADEKTQKSKARQAYQEALEQGFAAEDITLKDGQGKEIKPEDIFQAGQLAKLKKESKAQSITNTVLGKDQQFSKEAVDAIYKEELAKQNAAGAAGPQDESTSPKVE